MARCTFLLNVRDTVDVVQGLSCKPGRNQALVTAASKIKAVIDISQRARVGNDVTSGNASKARHSPGHYLVKERSFRPFPPAEPNSLQPSNHRMMQSVLHSVVGPKEVRPEELNDRVAIVTGGAQGIGYETSRALAHAGCKVIIVSRTADHGHAAIARIKEESPNAEVEWKDCDMGDLRQIKSVFSELRDSLKRIDFLVFSAGINASQYELTADGIERVFSINYLGQFYAANQLWPKIRETALTPGTTPAKIVAISSEMHRAAPSEVKFANLDEINDPSLDPVQLYARSKLAQILFVKFGLAGKVIKPKWDPIYAFAVHPGTVSTDIQQQWKDAYPGITGRLLKFAVTAVGRDAEQGSYSTLWALTAAELEDKLRNGAYFVDPEKPGSENSQTSDSILGAHLWELSEQLIKEKLGNDALIDWTK